MEQPGTRQEERYEANETHDVHRPKYKRSYQCPILLFDVVGIFLLSGLLCCDMLATHTLLIKNFGVSFDPLVQLLIRSNLHFTR